MNLGLDRKRVLVTGSYRGTGHATACAFAAEGASVFVHGFEPGQAEMVVAEITASGGDAHAVTADLMTDAGADAFADLLVAAGGIDVLVNNYGVAAGGSWDAMASTSWIEMYERNVLSGVRMAQRLVPAMREQGWGRVIFLGTVGGVRPRAVMPGYYAAKAALPAVVLSLAKELAGTGITVNCVSPGILRTVEVEAHFRSRAARKGWGEDWSEIEKRAIAETIGAGSPATRLGLTSEVAAAVVFLASEQAAYINAVDLRVDGGAADCVR
ncbi:MAG TPA: SDR family oxidoreductase [Candidatus Limnocylindrales bacterium]|nr:SDR family oxidoreductase [Candidatus Limnocylindrales bacterium]